MKKNLILTVIITILALTGCSTKPASESSDNSQASISADSMEVSTPEDDLSDTLQWFNATYAIITTRNEADYHLTGGYECNEMNKLMMKKGLQDSWDVTDRASADETLKWLTEDGGHNSELLAAYKDNKLNEYSREELMNSLSDESYTDLDKSYYLGIYDAAQKYGDNAIKAWDLSRAMQLSAWYYLAGYYTYEEAMDSSLEIALELQKTYKSWDDMMQSYFYGFQYWNDDDMTDETSESYARTQIYQNLKETKDGPYTVDWNCTLEKDW